MLGAAIATAIAISTFAISQLTKPTYVGLIHNLEPSNLQEILPLLDSENISYIVGPNKSSILVDRNSLNQANNLLAKNGLPAKSSSGYDHLNKNNSPYLTKTTEEQISRRVLEENLEKSILEIQSISKARVRLALGKNSQFLRDAEPSSASIVLTLHRGAYLNREQINGITRLVSYSVPNLPEENVVILDHTGRALATGGDSVMGSGSTASEYKFDVERALQLKVLELVGPIVGPENLRVNVEALIDFNKVENTTEEPITKNVVLSQQLEKSFDPELSGGGGVVGAVSNQPPNHAKFEESMNTDKQSETEAGISHIKETTNYSIGKSITHTVHAVGSIIRQDVAVLIDPSSIKEEELDLVKEQIRSLTLASIGFDEDRGDTFKIEAVAFVTPDIPEKTEPTFIETPLGKDLIEIAKILGGVLIAWLLFWRPLVKTLGKETEIPEPTVLTDDVATALSKEIDSSGHADDAEDTEADFNVEMTKAIELMSTKPTETQNVLQSWLAEISLNDLLSDDEAELNDVAQADDEQNVGVENDLGNENDK